MRDEAAIRRNRSICAAYAGGAERTVETGHSLQKYSTKASAFGSTFSDIKSPFLILDSFCF